MGHVTVEVRQSVFWMTNTGILTTPDGSIVLVDPGVLPHELAAIAKRAGEGRLLAAISTHDDWDHVLWSADFPADVPRLAHPTTIRVLANERDDILRSLSRAESDLEVRWDHDLMGRLDPVTGESVVLGDIHIRFIPTPGHTAGHTSLWLGEEGILFAGDMLSDIDIPMLAQVPGVGEDYLRSLDTLEPLLETATMVMPGHGSPSDGPEARRRLEADRTYIEALIAWSTNAGQDLPTLEAMMPHDIRAGRPENVDAHRQNGAAVGM